jgi:acyl-CoA thioester hydrolase
MTEQKTNVYLRPVYYYETDRMGIVHHSNYIRWLEEARLEVMRRQGVEYLEFEAQGVLMPVVDVSCRYRLSARFGDTVAVETELVEYSGVRAAYAYTIRNAADGAVLATAHSTHCFVEQSTHRPVHLRRRLPEIDRAIRRITAPETGEGETAR